MLGRRLERTPEIVEDGNELLHEPLPRAFAQRGLLARGPLAEVVELRGEPLQAVEELIALSLESFDVEALLRRGRTGRGAAAGPPNPLPPPPVAGGAVPPP